MAGCTCRRRAATGLLVLMIAVIPSRAASALIIGGEGNKPITDPGWPRGAAAVFNSPARVAWWEGPPFGGGQWHAECRGDARALGAVLADFARVEGRVKRVVLHDGEGASFWLNPNGEPDKAAAARIDWVFMVWQPARWGRHRRSPMGLSPGEARDADNGPPAQIDVYTGGGLRWADVIVPKGLEVIDQRLIAHGFTPADGIVLEGKATDLATGRPVVAAVRLERIETPAQGGYRYEVAARAVADAGGRWVLKNAPAGWHRVVVEADGFVPRIAGYIKFDDQPRWASYDCGLSRPAPVSGRIADDSGAPLADVEVRVDDVVSADGRYESPDGYACRTGADGRFHSDRVPIGRSRIWLHKRGYCRPGLGPAITTPAKDLELTMVKSCGVRVVVEFARGPRPPGYIVEIKPEGGAAVGTWGGSGNIDAGNRIAFHDAPPGKYVLRGRPNPSNGKDQTEPVTIELKGGQTLPVTLHAR
jgi:hypothetical protein